MRELTDMEKRLIKTEIEYIAKNGGGAVDYLQPHIGSEERTIQAMVDVGFKYKLTDTMSYPDGTPEGRELVTWIFMTNGVCVELEKGLVYYEKPQQASSKNTWRLPTVEAVEPRSQRVQLLVQPSVMEKVKLMAHRKGTSVNDLIHELLVEYTKNQ